MCFCAKLHPTTATLHNSKHLVIKDSKNTSRTDCGIYIENNIFYNHSTMGKDTNVPFWVGFVSFFEWVLAWISLWKLWLAGNTPLKNLNRGILVSLINQWLQCCPCKPGIWSDIKIIIYFLAKAGGSVHIILHLKTDKRRNPSSDGVHGYIEGGKKMSCFIWYYTILSFWYSLK